MMNKKSISVLVASIFLVLPMEMAKAGNVEIRSSNGGSTVVRGDDIRVTNGNSQVTIQRNRPAVRSSNRWRRIYNTRTRRSPWSVSPQVRRTQTSCRGGSTYSHQSSSTTTSSGSGVSRTQTSSTTTCR
ncbi:hypothetical protein H6G17_05390 [Chroococcidiopsis sp. FACHB-1243]|uniref:hypothetical protein n=1 Tax=Chroococcidiopsis sp. [FACHB-1243] TaxID=2692781 RepID=UPI00178175B1|nr:hypothetical protein [Chroococcidiopsis sp. [FACHB-1243]]MBD2304947.1 hypothetical protein [Chroococcidiopsis sp. [FACHB-1243]]